ncbi:MAG: pseudaminic acid synthase [Crocinitomicaceae bacterium]
MNLFERIQKEQGVFIIAELSANHNGDLQVALETIKAAKRAGADAIKLQTYTADTITLDVRNDYFRIDQGTAWDGEYLYDLYKRAYTPWEWHKQLFKLAKEEGLLCFSSPFDSSAVDFLEQFNPPAYKVASFEITDIPLIKYIAQQQRPIIISTGIADEADIELAIKTCQDVGNNNIAILKCTSAYPAKAEDANLMTIPEIKRKYNVLSGLSDHTLGIEAAVVAVSLGAQIIEKHFILDHSIGGPDAHFSLDEKSFKEMVDAVRRAEKMIGRVELEMTEKKKKNRAFARSLFVSEDVKKGDQITSKNVRSVRPGYGMHPSHYETVLGKTFTENFQKGTPLNKEMFE